MKPKSELSLYNVAQQIYALEEEIMRCGGEIGDEEENLIEQLQEFLTEEIDSFVQFTQEMDDDIATAKKRMEEIKQFIKVRENTRDRIKEYALQAMKRLSTDRVTGSLYEVKMRKAPVVLEITNENDVPIQFLNTETIVKVDKKALLEAVKAGEVDHPSIGLVDGKQSLMFKTKAIKK